MPMPAIIALLCLFFITPVQAAGSNRATHLDATKVGKGCATCHNALNFKTGGGAAICIMCHGEPSKSSPEYKLISKKINPKVKDLKNVEGEFKKNYRHPTFNLAGGGVHRANEILPEVDPKAIRHATCVDCHNVHYSSPINKFAGVKGKRIGNLSAPVTSEAELCYRCHGDSANLPVRSTNKRIMFAATNPSFHPVEAEGKNNAVVSLLKPYKEKKILPGDVSTLTCSSCHGSDDPSAPAGPHGSNYEHILVEQYSTKDNQPESPQNYALCYRCHSRTSILSDESFKYHALHLNGRTGSNTGFSGTSCYTCHDSHGSTEYRYLIKFNTDIVSPNGKGLLKFTEKGVASFRGECYLSCHDVEHDPKKY